MKSLEDSEMEIASHEYEKDVFFFINRAQVLLDLSMQKRHEL